MACIQRDMVPLTPTHRHIPFLSDDGNGNVSQRMPQQILSNVFTIRFRTVSRFVRWLSGEKWLDSLSFRPESEFIICLCYQHHFLIPSDIHFRRAIRENHKSSYSNPVSVEF
ncbi:unnamed protein product [Caenorhabditis sp. 36 PRJEB53466]|nr:unnamed protein product [Caenorhabditis sp. 36 PRJEB53466]